MIGSGAVSGVWDESLLLTASRRNPVRSDILLLCTALALAACGDAAGPVPDYTLTVSVSGTGEGTVTSVPTGIDCSSAGGSCSASFPRGTRVALSAAPAPRSTFVGWNGSSGAATHSVEVAASVTIDAAFDNPQRAGTEVGAAGAAITSRDGALTLEIPAGALTSPHRITVERLMPDQLGPELADVEAQYGVTVAYRLEPDGLQFAVPATVRLNVAGDASTSAGTMRLRAPRLILASGATREAPAVSVQRGTEDGSAVVTAQIGHFSYLVETKIFLATAAIGRVPDRVRVNEPFFADVTVVGEPTGGVGTPRQPLSHALYYRQSHDGIRRLPDQPVVALSRFDATEFYQGGFEYRCTVPGTGTYQGTVEVRYEDTGLTPSSFHFTSKVECLARPTLTVTKSGDGEGYVGSDVNGIQCGVECVAAFDAIDVVVTAIPSQGSRFAGWSGDCLVAPANSHRALVDMRPMQDRTCDARFDKVVGHMLEVGLGGAGTGTVTSEPAGIDCTKTATGTGGTCAAPFEEGTEVRLFGTPGEGAGFGGFSGNGTPAPDGGFVVPMDGPRSVTGFFFIAWGLNVDVIGEGHVTSEPLGIDCSAGGGSCSMMVPEGGTVVLTAHPADGWRFLGWDEDYSGGPASTSILMEGPRVIRATFQRIIQYRIGMDFKGTGSGTVVSAPAGINCIKTGDATTGACAADFDVGTELRLSATPSMGSAFSEWIGPGMTDDNGDRRLTVDGPADLTASFTIPPSMTVTASVANEHLIGSSPCPHAVGAIVIRNTGTGDFTWSAALPDGQTGFTLTSSSGVLRPGGSDHLTVLYDCNPWRSLTTTVTVTATAPDGDGTVTATTAAAMTVFEDAVRLGATLGPFAAGSDIGLRRIVGGYIAAPDACPERHLHAIEGTITIDERGPFGEPDPACGYGIIVRIRVD
jgi:hypothetical protein